MLVTDIILNIKSQEIRHSHYYISVRNYLNSLAKRYMYKKQPGSPLNQHFIQTSVNYNISSDLVFLNVSIAHLTCLIFVLTVFFLAVCSKLKMLVPSSVKIYVICCNRDES